MTTPKAKTSADLVARSPRMTSGASQRGLVAWEEEQGANDAVTAWGQSLTNTRR